MLVYTKHEVIFMFNSKDNDKENNCRMKVKVKKMSTTLPNMSRSKNSTDSLGSYTGTSSDGEKPVQDADDL
jgi:hypothetical protein